MKEAAKTALKEQDDITSAPAAESDFLDDSDLKVEEKSDNNESSLII